MAKSDEPAVGHCIRPQPIPGDKELFVDLEPPVPFNRMKTGNLNLLTNNKLHLPNHMQKEKIQQTQVKLKEAHNKTIACPINDLTGPFSTHARVLIILLLPIFPHTILISQELLP